VLRLDPLEELDRNEFLRRTGLPAPLHPRLAALSHGHPLALALLADIAADGDVPAALADVPDLVSALLEAVVSAAPTEAHAVALATCSRAWSTKEDPRADRRVPLPRRTARIRTRSVRRAGRVSYPRSSSG
jgi:hypothetical protein